MTRAQERLLHENGVSHPCELDAMRRLDFANLAGLPSDDDAILEISNPELSEGQIQYLGGRAITDLDDFQREIFNKIGPAPAAATAVALMGLQPAPRVAGGPPGLDTARLNRDHAGNVNLRLEIAYAYDVVMQNHRESLRGIPPENRESRREIVRARELVGPYLV